MRGRTLFASQELEQERYVLFTLSFYGLGELLRDDTQQLGVCVEVLRELSTGGVEELGREVRVGRHP